MFECYNLKEHNCDGRCQVPSDCIMAKRKHKPSRKEMIKYMIKHMKVLKMILKSI